MENMQLNDFVFIIIQSEGMNYVVDHYIEIREEFSKINMQVFPINNLYGKR